MSLLSKSASSEPPSLKATFSLSAGGAWGWGLGGGGCSADGGLLAFFSISGVSHGAGAVSPEVHHSVQLRSSMSRCRQDHLCEAKSLSPKCSMQPSRGLKTPPVFITVLTEVFFSATSATLTRCFNTDPSAYNWFPFKMHFWMQVRGVYSRLIFFLRRGQTTNQTNKAVTRAKPREMHSVPHHGTLSKPSTVHTRHERELRLR